MAFLKLSLLQISKLQTCIQISVEYGFGIEHGTIGLYLSVLGMPSLFPHQILQQTVKNQCVSITISSANTDIRKSLMWMVGKQVYTWCTRKANLTLCTISSSSSGLPPNISSSAETLFIYFMASFTDASLICNYSHHCCMFMSHHRYLSWFKLFWASNLIFFLTCRMLTRYFICFFWLNSDDNRFRSIVLQHT